MQCYMTHYFENFVVGSGFFCSQHWVFFNNLKTIAVWCYELTSTAHYLQDLSLKILSQKTSLTGYAAG